MARPTNPAYGDTYTNDNGQKLRWDAPGVYTNVSTGADGPVGDLLVVRDLSVRGVTAVSRTDIAYATNVTIDPTLTDTYRIGQCTGIMTLNCGLVPEGAYIEVSLEPNNNAITLGGDFILDPGSPTLQTATNIEVLILISRGRTGTENVYSIKNLPTI